MSLFSTKKHIYVIHLSSTEILTNDFLHGILILYGVPYEVQDVGVPPIQTYRAGHRGVNAHTLQWRRAKNHDRK